MALVSVIAIALFAVYVAMLDRQVSSRFEGQRWALPTQVFARPLELHVGSRMSPQDLVEELQRLGYQQSGRTERPGLYRVLGDGVEVATRGFTFWDGPEPSRQVHVRFAAADAPGAGSNGAPYARITDISDVATGEPVVLLRLDPSTIGSIYPRHGEDRVLVRLEDVPPTLIDALIAVEDRNFFSHHGVHPSSLVRAAIANFRAGSVVQGGSTITQQLVKNFYLDNRRTFRRKLDEAVMSILLEIRYDKEEILEAYLNEIYLGQDGGRAVHGFGLGSHFYFQRPLAELADHELALLVAVIRGPSFYEPRRRPERARERRDFVLRQLEAQQAISPEAGQRAREQDLGVLGPAQGQTRYPAFMGLVHRQLREHYRSEDLASEGLRIFTTVDPALQARTEQRIAGGLTRIERQRQMADGTLEAAAVVTDTDSGEVLALVGGRQSRFAGFNRALDARRPVGSLIKPFVYLTALEQAGYHAATLLDDDPLIVPLAGGREWEPRNFDRLWHGPVPLYRGLTESYNVATVRLGMDVGVERVIDVLGRMGLETRPPAFPSLLLGSVEMTPLAVADIYQTLASGGFRSPPRAIREVTTAEGRPLQRYPLSMQRAVDAQSAYLINRLLQEVVRSGTARRAGTELPADWRLAGKTGTSDGLRDSWFAGFGGDRLAVVWVGRDDNELAGLTGSVGALPLWIDIMGDARPRPLALRPPEGVRELWIEQASGLRSAQGCPDAVSLPFLEHNVPEAFGPCAGERNGDDQRPTRQPGLLERARRWFGG